MQIADYNFKVCDQPGKQYQRSNRITLLNPKGGQRQVTYEIETLTNAADGSFVTNPEGRMVISMPDGDNEVGRSGIIPLVGMDGTLYGEKNVGEMVDTILLYLNSHMVDQTTMAKAEQARQEQEMEDYEEQMRIEQEAEAERIRLEEIANLDNLIAHAESELTRLQALRDGQVEPEPEPEDDEPVEPVEPE